jgi:hypothetical protein
VLEIDGGVEKGGSGRGLVVCDVVGSEVGVVGSVVGAVGVVGVVGVVGAVGAFGGEGGGRGISKISTTSEYPLELYPPPKNILFVDDVDASQQRG